MKFKLERVDLYPATLVANSDGSETDEEVHNGIVLAADVAHNIATSSAMVFIPEYTKSFRTYRAMIHVFVEHPSHIPVLAGIYGFDEYSSYFSFFANISQFLFCYGTYTRLCT